MKKIFLSLCVLLSLYSVVYASDTKSDDEETLMLMKLIEEAQEKRRILERELQEEKVKTEEAKAKTEAVMQLGRTVDKLAKTLGVDD